MDDEDITFFWLDLRDYEDRMWDHASQYDHLGRDDGDDVADQEVEND